MKIPSLPYEIFLSDIIPFLSQNEMEKQVLQAIENRNLNDLYFFIGCTPTMVPSYLTCNPKYTEAAGFTLILPVLHFLGFSLSTKIFDAAANIGNLVIMKWLKLINCPWSERTFAISAKQGNLEIMKWLKENGCPWNDWAFLIAAKYGHLEVIKWLKESGCPWSEKTFKWAVHARYIENI